MKHIDTPSPSLPLQTAESKQQNHREESTDALRTRAFDDLPSAWKAAKEKLFTEHLNGVDAPFNAFRFSTEYCKIFFTLVDRVFEHACAAIGNDSRKDIAAFAFGSPSRYEMMGESDADILLIRKNGYPHFKEFHATFTKLIEPFEFCKIDVPEWGTISDCEQYLSHSVTEANQVIEARFICGDPSVQEEVCCLRQKHATRERFERTIAFQYLYFNQYYSQRGRPGLVNLKYGHGGTRDFLFPIWFVEMLAGTDIVQKNERTSLLVSLDALVNQGIINEEEAEEFAKSAAYVAYMRNALLHVNANTKDKGKTFSSMTALKAIVDRFPTLERDEETVHAELQRHLAAVLKLKEIVWSAFCTHVERTHNSGLPTIGRIALDDNAALHTVNRADALLGIFLIWAIRPTHPFFEECLNAASTSACWEVLTSLACRVDCPTRILHSLATNQGRKKGYEYVLKVIGRNPSTAVETVRAIAGDETIEYRFREPSITRLEKGVQEANQL